MLDGTQLCKLLHSHNGAYYVQVEAPIYVCRALLWWLVGFLNCSKHYEIFKVIGNVQFIRIKQWIVGENIHRCLAKVGFLQVCTWHTVIAEIIYIVVGSLCLTTNTKPVIPTLGALATFGLHWLISHWHEHFGHDNKYLRNVNCRWKNWRSSHMQCPSSYNEVGTTTSYRFNVHSLPNSLWVAS